MNRVYRPWGCYDLVHSSLNMWTKILYVHPGQALSLQYHRNRDEFWSPITSGLRAFIGDEDLDLTKGERYVVQAGTVHRIWNPTNLTCSLVEVATGFPSEDDIVRLEDDYGR